MKYTITATQTKVSLTHDNMQANGYTPVFLKQSPFQGSGYFDAFIRQKLAFFRVYSCPPFVKWTLIQALP